VKYEIWTTVRSAEVTSGEKPVKWCTDIHDLQVTGSDAWGSLRPSNNHSPPPPQTAVRELELDLGLPAPDEETKVQRVLSGPQPLAPAEEQRGPCCVPSRATISE
jgi:hypothetical protein